MPEPDGQMEQLSPARVPDALCPGGPPCSVHAPSRGIVGTEGALTWQRGWGWGTQQVPCSARALRHPVADYKA